MGSADAGAVTGVEKEINRSTASGGTTRARPSRLSSTPRRDLILDELLPGVASGTVSISTTASLRRSPAPSEAFRDRCCWGEDSWSFELYSLALDSDEYSEEEDEATESCLRGAFWADLSGAGAAG